MIIGEKEIVISWQLVDDETATNVGEETVTIQVWASLEDGFGWTPISHSSDIEGSLQESTLFVDSLGRRMLARAARWWADNEQILQGEDEDFAEWRHVNQIENEADRAWANSLQI